eukprot:3048183-Pyramimonas_sp.AAC.1
MLREKPTAEGGWPRSRRTLCSLKQQSSARANSKSSLSARRCMIHFENGVQRLGEESLRRRISLSDFTANGGRSSSPREVNRCNVMHI